MKLYANKMENMKGMDTFLQKHHLQKLNQKEIDNTNKCCSSVQFCHSVVSDSLLPHEPRHARPPCPSPTPRVHQDLYPWSRLCHPTISTSIIPSAPALKLTQHQGLFQWVGFSQWVGTILDYQLQISASKEHIGLISFWMDWLGLLAVQGKWFRGIEIKNA